MMQFTLQFYMEQWVFMGSGSTFDSKERALEVHPRYYAEKNLRKSYFGVFYAFYVSWHFFLKLTLFLRHKWWKKRQNVILMKVWYCWNKRLLFGFYQIFGFKLLDLIFWMVLNNCFSYWFFHLSSPLFKYSVIKNNFHNRN